jgi:uncharacterized protein YndB with AHSA1/START domain
MKRLFAIALCFAALAANAQERAIKSTVILPATLDQAWAAWTTTEGVKSFFAPDARVEARVDGPFEVYFNPFGAPGMKGADGMRFLSIQEKKMITFTWNAPPTMPEVRKQRTYVTVRFKARDEKTTEVTLYHGGWGEGAEWDKAFAYFGKAWNSVLLSLEERFVKGPIDWSEDLKRMRQMTPAVVEERAGSAKK